MLLNNIENILDSFSDGVIAIDKDLRIISFSKGAERITGFLAIDITGKNFNDVLKSKLDVYKSPIRDVLENGKSLANIRTKINNVDNKSITISITVTPLKDVKGEIVGVIINFRDIEEVFKLHAELYTENARLIAILNSITDGVLTVDNEWRITSFNPAAEMITGYRAEDVMGRQCHEIFKSEKCKENCPLKRTMKTQMPVYDYEMEIINANGETVPISVNTALLIDEQNKIIGGVETFRDLSFYKNVNEELNLKYSFANMIGKDKKMQEIYSLLQTISPTSTTILIMGETGTGKELVARAIHHNSPRKDKPFIKVDCASLPETLLESELFGYKKGAFTDARTDKPGKFELADSGTIFLDEIGNIPPSIQSKLLRVLEEHAFEPLGGMPITIPPLRDKPEDIPLLIEHFLSVFGRKFEKTITKLSQDAMDLLLDYPWPGNVRQLEHAIEHAFIHCTGRTIQIRHLPDDITQKSSILVDRILKTEDPIDEIEKEVFLEALKRNHWDREKTAKTLKISRITLWRKMKKYEIKNRKA